MATNQAAFDALLTQLGTAVTDEDAVITKALSASDTIIAKLVAALAAHEGNEDLTAEATAVQAMIADANTETENLTAEVTKLNAQ